MSIHVTVGPVQVKLLDHEGLHQLQNLNQTYSYVNAHQRSINLLDNIA